MREGVQITRTGMSLKMLHRVMGSRMQGHLLAGLPFKAELRKAKLPDRTQVGMAREG